MKRLRFKLFLVRIWSKNSPRIKRKIFWRNQIFVGSDKNADVTLLGLLPIQSRIDFTTTESHDLQSDRIEIFKFGELIKMGEYILQCKELEVSRNHFLLTIGFIFTSLFIFILYPKVLRNKTEVICSDRANFIQHGRWKMLEESEAEDLLTSKKVIVESIRGKQWVRARLEVKELEQKVRQALGAESLCWPEAVFAKFELKIVKGILGEYIKDQKLTAAAGEVKRFNERYRVFENMTDRLTATLLKAARQQYLEGYRAEEANLDRGEEIMDQAQEVCGILELKEDCFRQRARRPSGTHPTVKSPHEIKPSDEEGASGGS